MCRQDDTGAQEGKAAAEDTPGDTKQNIDDDEEQEKTRGEFF